MAARNLEERIEKLESDLHEIQKQLAQQPSTKKRGWRWFVGIDADNPHFDEAVRLGQEWRYSDRPFYLLCDDRSSVR
jgi:hypothetical protein